MTINIEPTAIARLSKAVPRYTSYPTAPHFQAEIDGQTYRNWLSELPKGSRVSLYLHIPFCDTLCWFCGCHTRMVKRYEPVSAYLSVLELELKAVSAALPESCIVTHIHWGGGSPTMLSPDDIYRLGGALRTHFTLAPDCDFAVEIDPRGMDNARLDAFVACGLTRASIGVQDFDPRVQTAINRFQSVEETTRVVNGLRQRGIRSLNVDMLYGLPHQSTEAMLDSLKAVLALKPDRLALFGYAHVPWMKKHQEMIDVDTLPDMIERIKSVEYAGAMLKEAGYDAVGIDHFALPEDSLAMAAKAGTLRRNFQGYTTDDSDALIGLGASAIGQLPQGFIQNQAGGQAYERKIREDGLAIARGITLSADDRVRADAIEDLMCNLRFDHVRLSERHGALLVEPLIEEAEALLSEETTDLVKRTPTGFMIEEAGRRYLRTFAARFDAYLPRGAGRHSSAL